MPYYKKIAGERVYLSPINPDDAEIYTKWLNDPEVTRNIGMHVRAIPLNAEREILERLSREHNYAIVRSEDDILLGNIGLHDINFTNRTATVGIFIGEAENRSRGYGTEAMRLIVEYAFKTLNIRNVMLTVHGDNPRAQRSYVKAGFREIGRRTGALYKNGEYVDCIYMEIVQ